MAEKEAYVEMCLKMCGLEDYGDAIVGSLGVEHKKRTTIGVELAAKVCSFVILALDGFNLYEIIAKIASFPR